MKALDLVPGYLIFGGIFLAVFVFAAAYAFVEIYSRGYRDGLKAGEAWIVKLESDVDQARQEIWREEG